MTSDEQLQFLIYLLKNFSKSIILKNIILKKNILYCFVKVAPFEILCSSKICTKEAIL